MGVSARMKVSGIITATTSSACTNPVPPFDIWWSGNRFASLGPIEGAAIKWFLGPITGQEFPNSFGFFDGGQPDSGVAIWSPTESDNNSEIIFRREPFSVACGSSPAYLLSGQQQVQVDFMTVHVTASKTSIQANEPVTFTATPINFTPSDPGYIYWEYHRDDAPGVPIAVESCFGQPTCTFGPPARGKMLALMLVSGGGVPGYSPRISIIKCPTGDALLDNPRFRDSLLVALQMSRADSVPFSSRREVGGHLYTDPDGTLQIKFSYKDSTPCANTTLFPGSAIAVFHTHPFSPREGTVPADTVPFICFNAAGSYEDEKYGGPSSLDWQGSVAIGKPMYVIDKKRVYKTNPSVADPTKWADSSKVWDWNTAACKWN